MHMAKYCPDCPCSRGKPRGTLTYRCMLKLRPLFLSSTSIHTHLRTRRDSAEIDHFSGTVAATPPSLFTSMTHNWIYAVNGILFMLQRPPSRRKFGIRRSLCFYCSPAFWTSERPTTVSSNPGSCLIILPALAQKQACSTLSSLDVF